MCLDAKSDMVIHRERTKKERTYMYVSIYIYMYVCFVLCAHIYNRRTRLLQFFLEFGVKSNTLRRNAFGFLCQIHHISFESPH